MVHRSTKERIFACYIVFDGEVVETIMPSDDPYSEFLLKNVDEIGTLEYVMVGECTSFGFLADRF